MHVRESYASDFVESSVYLNVMWLSTFVLKLCACSSINLNGMR